MTLIDEQERPPGVSPPPPEATESSPYQPCDNCGAPLDDRQRYCVSCGERRKHADDPAARYLSTATRRRRTSAAKSSPAAGRRRATASLATAAMIAAIPVMLGAGVLIGRSSAGGDGKLIAALHAQKAPVVEYSGATPAASGASTGAGAGTGPSKVASVSTTPPTSTFSLKRGYTVQLGTLPSSATQTAAAQAEKSDKAKGATTVGIIAQSDFTVTPSPPGAAFVVYSGAYPTQGAAEQALGKLEKKFSAAKVVKVVSTAAAAKGGGKVLAKTNYGSAHQATGYKPNSTALQQGAQVVQQDSHDTGKAASGSGLPDVVAVP